MTLPDRQDPVCGTCGATFGGPLAVALSHGWGYWNGKTSGGTEAEYVICKKCRTEGHKRPLPPVKEYEDEPLF
jgi:hypothetical protein